MTCYDLFIKWNRTSEKYRIIRNRMINSKNDEEAKKIAKMYNQIEKLYYSLQDKLEKIILIYDGRRYTALSLAIRLRMTEEPLLEDVDKVKLNKLLVLFKNTQID